MPAPLILLTLATTAFNPLPDCEFKRPIKFFQNMDALPPEISQDIERRAGTILPISWRPGAPLPADSRPKRLVYVAQSGPVWFLSYGYTAFVSRVVTVSYMADDDAGKRPLLLGALYGDRCNALNAFLGGAAVAAGWEPQN